MKKDIKQVLKNFSQTNIKNGDLVITFEIHRVLDVNWGRKNNSQGMEVATVFPKCSACGDKECRHPHIMARDGAGQHKAAKLAFTHPAK